MSCDLIYTPDGRRGVGVNQPQSGLDYPLIAPSVDIQYLLADFYLAYEDTAQEFKHPLRIKWLYGVGCAVTPPPAGTPTPTHAADILIVDADERTVFNSTILGTDAGIARFASWCWGLKKNSAACLNDYAYRAYEWVSNKAVCRLIAYQTWPPSAADADSDAVREYPVNLVPVNATLDERTVYKVPKRVTAFILPALNNIKLVRTAVDFVAGFNTQLTAGDEEERNLRKTRQVTFNVEPGAGLGKYTDCEDPELPIYRINGLTGPDILITADKCLWMRIPTNFNAGSTALIPVKQGGHVTQIIGSNCPACCTCDDYVGLANYMNVTRDRYKEIGDGLNGVLLAHSDNIERWSTQRECRARTPIKACMTAQRCPFIDVIVQYCNLCEKCAEDVTLNLAFTAPGNSATIACGYTTVTNKDVKGGLYQLDGDWPNYKAKLGKVDAGNASNVTFRLEFANAAPTVVGLTATGTTKAGPVLVGCATDLDPAAANVTKSLYCDSDGNTIAVCG
jgi:hypothetical protein